MFQVPDASRRTRSQQQQQLKPTNENIKSRQVNGKEYTTATIANDETRATRKRRALGDVSNVNTSQAEASKPVPGKVIKARPVRSAAVAAIKKLHGAVAPSQSYENKVPKSNVGHVVVAKKEVVVETIKGEVVVARKRQKTDEKQVIQEWDDLDSDDKLDPVMASEYVVEIFEYLRELELTTMSNPQYIGHQKELSWKMRSTLIDWLVEVHIKYKLLPETLYLTVNLIDRFLSLRSVSLAKFQLVGITATFIAAKYEEVYAPSISQFVYIADGTFSHDEIIRAERYMLQVLGFKLHFPNPLNFLRRCSKADGYDVQTRTLAKYFMEIALLDSDCLEFTPSIIAASGMYLARAMVGHSDVWTPNMRHYSGYHENELRPCLREILDFLSGPKLAKFPAIKTKFASSKLFGASVFVNNWILARREKDGWGLDVLVCPIAHRTRSSGAGMVKNKSMQDLVNKPHYEDDESGPFFKSVFAVSEEENEVSEDDESDDDEQEESEDDDDEKKEQD